MVIPARHDDRRRTRRGPTAVPVSLRRRMSKVEGGASTGRRLSQLAEIPVSTLETVKPRKAEALADWAVTSVLDLLTTYPRRYIDRTRAADVADLAVGDEAVVFAEVKRTRANRNPRGRSRVEVSFSFFFQADDGIRDTSVTGVQTWALPIYIEPKDIARVRGARWTHCSLVLRI